MAETWKENSKLVLNSMARLDQNYSKLDGKITDGFKAVESQITALRERIDGEFHGESGMIPRIVELEYLSEEIHRKDKRNRQILAGVVIALISKIAFDFLVMLPHLSKMAEGMK